VKRWSKVEAVDMVAMAVVKAHMSAAAVMTPLRQRYDGQELRCKHSGRSAQDRIHLSHLTATGGRQKKQNTW